MQSCDDADEILRRQHGVIGYDQARAAGLSKEAIRWRVSTGAWTRVRRGVYRLAATTPTWHSRAHTLARLLGDTGGLTLDTAAHLHGVESRQPPIITGAAVGRDVLRLTGTRVARRRHLDLVRRQDLPVTSAAGTVLDLTDVPGTGWREAVHVVARWIHRTPLTAELLTTALTHRPRHRHRSVITTALRPIVDGAESILEVTALERVIGAHGLPAPRLQVPVQPGVSGARRDAEWEEFGVVLELDGLLGHDGENMFRDRSRDRHAATTGRLTLRAGHVEVSYAPCELAMDIVLTLRTRGYRGLPVRCGPRCRIH